MTANAGGQHDRGEDTDRRKHEQVRALQPSVHDLQVFGERIDEHDDQNEQQSEREVGNLAIGRFREFLGVQGFGELVEVTI